MGCFDFRAIIRELSQKKASSKIDKKILKEKK